MNAHELAVLISAVRDGSLDPDDALARLKRLPFAEVAGARIDHHRTLRTGQPEAVYGPGKSPGQCARIVNEMLRGGTGPVLLTRATRVQTEAAVEACPGGKVHRHPIGSTSAPLTLRWATLSRRPWCGGQPPPAPNG